MVRVLVLLTVVFFASCSQRLVDFTLISSKNVEISRGADFVRDSKRVTGEDARYIIVIFPTGIPNAKEALDRAIESVPGAVALLDGVITSHWYYIPYIFGKTYYTVTGTALIDPKLLKNASLLDEFPLYSEIRMDKNGNIEKHLAIDKATYLQLCEKYK